MLPRGSQLAGSFKRDFKKGDILLREGDEGDCAYIIEKGNVEVIVQRQGRLLQIGTRGPGSIIGEMAMIDDKPRTATVRALEDCSVLEISRDDFMRRVDAADPVLKLVMHVITTRYRDMISRTEGFRNPFGLASVEETENAGEAHDIAVSTIKIDHELRRALQEKQLVLFYQPIIDLQKMKIAGFEALMRWKHPEKGMISPGVFIPVAEESGLIVEMSRWALEDSCDAIKTLQAAAKPGLVADAPLFVSVNFSVKDFSNAGFFDQVCKTLERKNASVQQIHVEITESLLMGAPEQSKKVLGKFRDHGIHVSIDDFGSGYSSLSYLHHFPIDTLKIDQSFVRSMTTNENSLMLVRSIVGLARNLKMKIIAEGIETPEEAKIIRDLGCEECQGFWFSKPLPLEAALKFVQEWQPPKIA